MSSPAEQFRAAIRNAGTARLMRSTPLAMLWPSALRCGRKPARSASGPWSPITQTTVCALRKMPHYLVVGFFRPGVRSMSALAAGL